MIRTRSVRERRRTAAMLVALLVAQVGVVVGMPANPASAADVSDNDCGEVMLYWARGSGQGDDGSNTPEKGTFFSEIRRRLPGGFDIREHEAGEADGYRGNDYPTTGDRNDLLWAKTRSNETNGDYYLSVNEGVAEVLPYLNSRAVNCPSEKWILGGYSQGAHVLGNVMRNSALSDAAKAHIAYLAFVGDPKFQQAGRSEACAGRNKWWVKGNPNCQNTLGSLAKTTDGSYLPDVLNGRAGSWCDTGDPICGGTFLQGGGSHGAYPDLWLPAAALEAVKGLRSSLPGRPDSAFDTRPSGSSTAGNIDVAIVFDTTGSMGGIISAAKARASEIAQSVFAMNGRVSLVQYRDHGDDLVSRLEVPFTTSFDEFNAGLARLYSSGGGDTPEAVFSGLMTAFNDQEWTYGARKVAFVIADAPGKDPEPVTGFTRETVVRRALELDPVAIFPITNGSIPFFEPLATETAGEVIPVSGDAGAALLRALAIVAGNPVPLVNGPLYAEPGQTVTFDATASYDPDSTIDYYEWDFDGDGVADETTETGIVDHVYAAPFTGQAFVKLLSTDGGVALGGVQVNVAPGILDAEAVLAVGNPTATLSPDGTATVTWQAPPGNPVDGYLVIPSDPNLEPRTVEGNSTTYTGVGSAEPLFFLIQPYRGPVAGPATSTNVVDTTVRVRLELDRRNARSLDVAKAGQSSGRFTLSALVRAEPGTVAPTDALVAVPSRVTLVSAIDGTPVAGGTCTRTPSGTGAAAQVRVSCPFDKVAPGLYAVGASVDGRSDVAKPVDLLVVGDPSAGLLAGAGTVRIPGSADKVTFVTAVIDPGKGRRSTGAFAAVRHGVDGSHLLVGTSIYGLTSGGSRSNRWAAFGARATFDPPTAPPKSSLLLGVSLRKAPGRTEVHLELTDTWGTPIPAFTFIGWTPLASGSVSLPG